MLTMIAMDICLLVTLATVSGCLIGWYYDDWGGRGCGHGGGGGHRNDHDQ